MDVIIDEMKALKYKTLGAELAHAYIAHTQYYYRRKGLSTAEGGKGHVIRDPSKFKPCLYLVRTANRTYQRRINMHTYTRLSGPGQQIS